MAKWKMMEKDFKINVVVRVEAKGRQTYVIYNDGSKDAVGNSIDELEQEFASWNFVRIHPNHLINPEYFNKVSKLVTDAVEMKDGTVLPAEKGLMEGLQNKGRSGWKQKLLNIFNL